MQSRNIFFNIILAQLFSLLLQGFFGKTMNYSFIDVYTCGCVARYAPTDKKQATNIELYKNHKP
jgi:hypothetical protein